MIKSSMSAARRALGKVWEFWCRLAQAVLGAWQWEAPPWARASAAGLRTLRLRTMAVSRCHPRAAAAAALPLLALVLGAGAAWRWYRLLPPPEYAAVAVTAPERTRIEVEGAKPEPLRIGFDRSAAALALAGKELPAGATLHPALAGAWRWLDDRTLEFRPKQDWPIGRRYAVTLDKSLFGPRILLAQYRLEFSSAPFSARIVNAELYQDPVSPGIKRGVFDFRFTHPVDPAEFERRIEVRLAGQSRGVLGVGRETTEFTVTYDKLKLNASVHSAALPIPRDATQLGIRMDAGVRAARGGNRIAAPLTRTVRVPGLYSLEVLGVQPLVVNNERSDPDQVLLLNLSAATGERDVARAIKAWILPTVRPAHDLTPAAGRDEAPYPWYSAAEVTAEVLAKAAPLPLEPIAAEREFAESHSLRFHADVGRYVYVQIDRDLRSFGGYLSAKPARFIVRVPPFPPELELVSQGAVLALSGERKVAALARDVPGMRIDIGRVLPAQLQHLVSQSDGDFSHPNFSGSFGADNLTERFVRRIPLEGAAHGKAHYEAIDLGEYLRGGAEKHGVFLLTLSSYDPRREAARQRAAAARAAEAKRPGVGTGLGEAEPDPASGIRAPPDDLPDSDQPAPTDQRLILVTDLGILDKKSIDGTQDVFVQSIASGRPVQGATVEIVAKNGTVLLSQLTDASGRAHFSRLDGLVRERAPLLVQVTKGGDLSFLPLDRADRSLDYSRFDVGGVSNARNARQLSAYLFSDRGLYRPGDVMHIGMIVKTAAWSDDAAGIPLESEVLDARGLTVKRGRFNLPAGGFAELSCATAAGAPTGLYTVNVYIVKDDLPGALLGSTSVRVQEFEPDRMKVSAHLSAQSADGWVSPKDLKALIGVQNLFGTPAEHRRVAATLTLTPAFPAFRGWPDFRFYDPLRAREGYDTTLADASTDAMGNATFDLNLEKYARATYRVHLLARAFEPEGGRSVAADAAALVSELPFLVGFKPDGALDYVAKGSARRVSLVAIDPAAKRTAASGLTLRRIAIQFVSVLIKQDNGTYKYESRKKEVTLSDEPLSFTAAGRDLVLATDTPGSYAYVIRDAAGLELNRVEYDVAGQGNLSRSLDRNAELQITLNKKDFAPGEDIELSIKAPYAGAGLITIERDHIYAAQWFKSDTSASVQKIRLPGDFQGNGYVTVQFIRDPGSDEIFTSPLSYGVMPFATSLAERTNALNLEVAPTIEPGGTLHMKLGVAQPSRVVLFAVDEGILQVAGYQAPDPLGEFFKKRALEVKSSQILDLILPEFKRMLAAAAPGGDGEAALRRNLNPFKRRHDAPAVYWSGIVSVEHERDFTWPVPDSFNGSIKIFAVAVNEHAVGTAQSRTLSRGDFVLTPNLPAAVSPGDEFEVSVGVANNVPGSGKGAGITVSAELPPQLEAAGPLRRVLTLDETREGVAVFRFRARAQLGSAPIAFAAAWQDRMARRVDTLSVRPASPYAVDIQAGYFGAAATIPLSRDLYPDYRKLELAVSSQPLGLTAGLADYLNDYPHLCTEQLVSRGFPALVLARRPELADPAAAARKPGEAASALVAVLRSRQNAEGGFGLWAASVTADEFASVYAVHWMLEAREQGEAIPADLLQKSLAWLLQYAASPVLDASSSGLWELRNRAYAAYLLTRQGMVSTPLIAALRERLEARYPREWKSDMAAAYLAAAYRLMKQDREAAALIERPAALLGQPSARHFTRYYDDSARDAQLLYLVSRHFPERARALPPQVLQSLAAPLNRGEYNTLSAAFLVLAFDAYAARVQSAGLGRFTATQTAANGRQSALKLEGQMLLRSGFDGGSKALHLSNGTGLGGFYAVTSAGFDRQPPGAELRQGMEIQRDYLDAEGRPVTSVKTGDQITVRLRLRATDADMIYDVAVTDLLPGGFEPVPQAPDFAGAAAPDQAQAHDPAASSAGAMDTWQPQFADVREDRVVIYGSISKQMAEYRYRIRATNAGTFRVPPSFAESMYDRSLRARAAGGSIVVKRPGTP